MLIGGAPFGSCTVIAAAKTVLAEYILFHNDTICQKT